MRTMAFDLDGGRMRGRIMLVVAVGMLTAGVTMRALSDPQPPTWPIYELTGEEDRSPQEPVLRAVYRSREAGNARTESLSPPGVTPSRNTGVVDFRAGRSDTVVEILREDGTAIRYGRMVRTPEAVYAGMYLGQPEPAWRRIEHDTPAADGATGFQVDGLILLEEIEEQHGSLVPDPLARRGRTYHRPEPLTEPPASLVILSFDLDNKARVGVVRYTLPTLADHVFTMTFTDYGDAPPVEVPTADV